MNKDFELNSVYFYITGGCNLQCRHCWITPDSTEKDMDTTGVKKVVEEANDMGVRHIKLTGGEPFVRKDIFEILHFIREKDMAITIETNGTFIKDKEAHELKELKISHISVSIDDFNPEIHDDLRGVKGSFFMAVEGIKTLSKAGFKPQMIASIYKRNINDIKRLALFAQSVGAGSLKINPIANIGRGKQMGEKNELLSVKEIIGLDKRIDSEIQPSVDIEILLDIPIAFKKTDYIKKHRGMCNILGIIGLLSDGTISMCGIGKEVSELNMGNIRQDRLKDVWEKSPVLKSIRESIPGKLEGACSKCIFKRLCLGKCRAEAYYRTGSLTAPFYFCQEAFDKGLFPKTRLL